MSEGNFKVYKSSAGSGKTFTLVKEFLQHCLKGNDYFEFSRILAITFTNKATFEMKTRILSALKELSNREPKADDLRDLLLKETQMSEQDLVFKCQQILRTILHNYADFGISTIDKFTHRVIRTFSKDLNLSPVFQVELDEQRLLIEVIDNLINQVGKNERITQLILDFTLSRMEEEKRWKVDGELISFSSSILQERAIPYLREMRALSAEDYKNAISIYQKLIQSIEQKIVKISKKAYDLIHSEGIEHSSFSGNSKLSAYFKKLSEGNYSMLQPSNQLAKNMAEDKWFSGKCPSDQKMSIENVKPQLQLAYDELQMVLNKDYPIYLSALEILKPIHSLSLLNEIEKKLAEYKKEEKLLNISDFNRIISEVVMREPMPFIYERLGEKYRSVMIDEFQDTSVLQFMNLLPLIEDSLSRGNESLLVGDAKQAIYRFRGGEVEQFSEMPHYVPELFDEKDLYEERMRSLQYQYKKEQLQYNYRSGSILVQFNNDFFEYVKTLPQISPKIPPIFDGHRQLLPSNKKSGYVEISFSEGKSKEDKTERYQRKTHESIQQCLADGYALKDITLLFSKKSQAAEMAAFLKSVGIDIISSEALLLSNDLNVSFLVNFADWLNSPEDHLLQKEMVEYFYQRGALKISIEEAFEIYTGSKASISRLFDDLGYIFSVEDLQLKAPFEFFETCIRLFSLSDTYSVYLQSIQDQVLDYSKSIKGNLEQFVDWWRENTDRLSLDIPEGLNAVNLMTVHKSKGLEFPVVIFPYADFSIQHSSAFINKFVWTKTPDYPTVNLPFALVEFQKNLKESSLHEAYTLEHEKSQIDLINAAYVALTRASERMYIHTELPKKSRGEKLFNLPDLLYSFATLSMEPYGEDLYRLGVTELKQTEKTETEKESTEPMSYISNAWQDKLTISLTHKSKWKEQEEVMYGVLLHDILGQINFLEDVRTVLDGFELKGIVGSKERVDIEQKLNSIISKQQIKPFFEGDIRIKNEASIIDRSGKLLRPDRVVFMEDKVVVLDYKTGEKNESHHKQVNEYIHAIASTTQLVVEGYVLYTEKEELVVV